MIRANSYVKFSGAQDDAENRKQKPKPYNPPVWQGIGKALGAAHTKANTPAAPAAPGAPAATPFKSDSVYDTQITGITSRLNSQEAAATNDENALGVDYGVAFDRNPDGSLTNFRVDLSNPFSKMALLQKTFDQGQKSTTGQLANRGQLYSGYLQSKLQQGVTQHEQGKHDVISGFGGAAREILQRRLTNRGEAGEAGERAAADLAGRQVNAGPQPASAPPPAQQNAQQQLKGAGKPWEGRPLKWTASGLFYQRATDKKWIPVS